MKINRRSFLRSIVVGAAIAFPVSRIVLQDDRSIAQRLADQTGREIFVITMGQSSMAGTNWVKPNPKVFDWSVGSMPKRVV